MLIRFSFLFLTKSKCTVKINSGACDAEEVCQVYFCYNSMISNQPCTSTAMKHCLSIISTSQLQGEVIMKGERRQEVKDRLKEISFATHHHLYHSQDNEGGFPFSHIRAICRLIKNLCMQIHTVIFKIAMCIINTAETQWWTSLHLCICDKWRSSGALCLKPDGFFLSMFHIINNSTQRKQDSLHPLI